MSIRPILFSGPMVRAILDGRKTQTRRAIKPQPNNPSTFGVSPIWGRGVGPDGKYRIHAATNVDGDRVDRFICAPAGPGDILWVRERFRIEQGSACYYTACPCGLEGQPGEKGWRPSIHMPRWACRLWLEVLNVRVERVQEISNLDAHDEGIDGPYDDGIPHEVIDKFIDLWDSLNAKRGYSWASNPWVWVIEFKRIAMPANWPEG